MLLPLLCISSCTTKSGELNMASTLALTLAAPVIVVGVPVMFKIAEAQTKAELARHERERNKRKDGPFTEYWQKGKKSSGKRAEGTFKNKELDGLYKQWWPSGRKWKEEHWEEGKLVSSTSWHENGQKSGENGAGRSANWYESGQMQRENVYKDESRPLLATKETEWYESGQMRSLCTHKDGTRHGVWTEWYESGQKSHEANYKDGRETRQTQWHANGQMSHQIVYKSPSRRLYQKSWNEKGELISEERW